MNVQKLGVGAFASAAGLGAGIGTLALTKKFYEKVDEKTEKPVGAIGSYAHIVTNDKIENKKSALAEITKESLKDTGKLFGAAGIGAGAAALVTGLSKNVQKGVNTLVGNIGKSLDKISIPRNQLVDSIVPVELPKTITLKDKLKGAKIVKKFLNATPAAKAAALVGAAILAIATPIALINSSAKAGYVEAKHETK